jgi:glutathione synthase/RimK-type ligase-like ATP-grasp enzyme
MKTILITGIGGSIGIDIARSLRPDPTLRLIGGDCSEFGRLQTADLVDEVIATPRADRGAVAFYDALVDIIAKAGVDFAFVNPDPELEGLAEVGRELPCKSSMPPIETVGISLDKAATVARTGLDAEFPRTLALAGDDDLERCFAQLTPPMWMRSAIGAGGRGALTVETVDEAMAWISYWSRRGRAYDWMLQEFLPGKNINWTGLYVGGELITHAAMERLRYFLGDSAASGVSGQVAQCRTVNSTDYIEVSDRVVRALDAEPRGIYSVDLRDDSDGKPRVTEVNPRLAARPWLYTNAGVNVALAAVRALTGDEVGDAVSEQGLRVGLHLYRQLDIDPVIAMPSE